MKETTRKTRSATRFKTTSRVEIPAKKEEDANKVDLKQHKSFATSSLDPVVKFEANEVDLKSQAPKVEGEKGKKKKCLASYAPKLLNKIK